MSARGNSVLPDTTSVTCLRPAATTRRWNCTFDGRWHRTVGVAVDRRGGWATDNIELPPIARTTAGDPEFTSGGALVGCCVPPPPAN